MRGINWRESARRIPWVVALLALFWMPAIGRSADGFADAAFERQWRQDETIAANFWGPLDTVKDGQQEPYREATGGRRLVQYFQKGRMELTNGSVTNGLLTTELLHGGIQIGDDSFQAKAPPAIPVAGDPDTPGPTYAMVAALPKLLSIAPAKLGGNVTFAVTSDGELTSSLIPKTPATMIASYDMATGHNIPQALADYRQHAGLATIGYAITEPFHATVRIAGKERDVVIQGFERRILTYTADNPDAFKVEMGNIGQHYVRWRYTTEHVLPPAVPAPSVATVTVTPPSAPPSPSVPANTSFLLPTATSGMSLSPTAPPTNTPRPAIAGPKYP